MPTEHPFRRFQEVYFTLSTAPRFSEAGTTFAIDHVTLFYPWGGGSSGNTLRPFLLRASLVPFLLGINVLLPGMQYARVQGFVFMLLCCFVSP